jgi:hypothetical protein
MKKLLSTILSTFRGFISRTTSKTIALELNSPVVALESTKSGTYTIFVDFWQLHDGDIIILTFDVYLNNVWRTLFKRTIENYQAEPIFMETFEHLDGLRITLRQRIGTPKNIYIKSVRR